MKVSATELANDSKRVLDQVINGNQTVQVQRHGKTVAVIQPQKGVSAQELIRRMRQVRFTEAERAQLRKAMEDAETAFANGDRA